MSKIILFNADDWGLSQQIHDSITSLADQNAIDAAGIMVGQKFTSKAVEYAKNHPKLRVGLHLFASDSDCIPLTMPRWPRLWPDNVWVNLVTGLPSARKVILAEVEAQLLAWKETQLPLHFLNSHFQFHANHRVVYPILKLLHTHFPNFKGWVRLGDIRTMPGTLMDAGDPLADLIERGIFVQDWQGWSNDTLWGIDQTFANQAKHVIAATDSLGSGFHEFFFHPGRGTSLADNGTDHQALLDLAKQLPASARNVSLLPNSI